MRTLTVADGSFAVADEDSVSGFNSNDKNTFDYYEYRDDRVNRNTAGGGCMEIIVKFNGDIFSAAASVVPATGSAISSSQQKVPHAEAFITAITFPHFLHLKPTYSTLSPIFVYEIIYNPELSFRMSMTPN